MAKSKDQAHRMDSNCHTPDLVPVFECICRKWWIEPGFIAS